MAKSILTNIPLYYFSIFACPNNMINLLEKLIRNFLWEGSKEFGATNLINWETTSVWVLAMCNLTIKNRALAK